MVEPQELPEYDSSHVTNISHADVAAVNAELVRMYQADAETITAGEVSMENSAAGNLKAERLTARNSALGWVEAGEVHVEAGAVGVARAEEMSASGYAGLVVARSADVHHSTVGYLAAQDVQASEVRTVVLLARNVNGHVVTTLDTRGVVLAGLIGGLFGGLMLLLGRFLLRRT